VPLQALAVHPSADIKHDLMTQSDIGLIQGLRRFWAWAHSDQSTVSGSREMGLSEHYACTSGEGGYLIRGRFELQIATRSDSDHSLKNAEGIFRLFSRYLL
jgi:hypothetical protein